MLKHRIASSSLGLSFLINEMEGVDYVLGGPFRSHHPCLESHLLLLPSGQGPAQALPPPTPLASLITHPPAEWPSTWALASKVPLVPTASPLKGDTQESRE